jgi:hypothetical protein
MSSTQTSGVTDLAPGATSERDMLLSKPHSTRLNANKTVGLGVSIALLTRECVMEVEAGPRAEVRPSIPHFRICARSLIRLKFSPQSVLGRKMRSVGYEGGR